MNRRQFLKTGLAATTLGLSGCVGIRDEIYPKIVRESHGIQQKDLVRKIIENYSSNLGHSDESLIDPFLSFEHPDKHFTRRDLTPQELTHMSIGVDTQTRNVFVFNNERRVVFRAPTILGDLGRNLRGDYYTSSFSGPGVLWAPVNKPRVLIDNNVFGDLWVPMQNYSRNGESIPVDRFENGWAPERYNLYAIHGTNNNEAFENAQRFRNTSSRGCSRLYKDAVPDLRRILELASPGRFDISYTARGKNPNGETIALGRIIPVSFGRNLV
ncbi:MAG: twin-arginine translocation signal domain-containing protein [Candidatus Woesearchaeota archaeon]